MPGLPHGANKVGKNCTVYDISNTWPYTKASLKHTVITESMQQWSLKKVSSLVCLGFCPVTKRPLLTVQQITYYIS